jgi:GNAT superfamily N-acetyltransferase
MKANHASLMPHVGTEPDLQGTGQGSAMMKRIVQLADQANADCYLEANGLGNEKFYQKFGIFVPRDRAS